MSYLNHVVTTKGFIHSFERSAQILKRFIMGRRNFLQMISFLQGNLNGGTKITFCITASLLWENVVLFRKLRQIGHDVAAHGYIHTNMKNKSKKEQIEIIRKCSRAFTRFHMPVSGFRCPYLSYNNDTLEVLERGGFAWTSNNMVLWPNGIHANGNGREHKCLRKIDTLYHIDYAENRPALPRFRNGCLDIPITGPDDEMLLERFRVRNKAKIVEVWTSVLRKTYEQGGLFHLLFHPERFHYIRDCIKEIVTGLKSFEKPIWVASLTEITEWWRSRQGLSWEHERLGDGALRTWVRVPARATMLMKSPEGSPPAQAPFFEDYMAARPVGSRNGSSAYPCVEGRKATVGLSAACPREAETFLREEGFLVERSSSPGEHAVFIDRYATFARQDEAAMLAEIENSPFPVLRLWRWPDGMRSGFTVSADVDSVTLMDFVRRALEF